MITKTNRVRIAVATLTSSALLLAASTARAERPEKASSLPKPVIVENTEPIPVQGEVTATVDGTVPVLVQNPNPLTVTGTILVENSDPIPVAGAVTVANEEPISVEGDINAVVTGIVEVEDFNSQMNSLRSEMREVRKAVEHLETEKPLGWSFVREKDIDNTFTPTGNFTWKMVSHGAGWTNIEQIILSAENDKIVFRLYSDLDCTDKVFSVGSGGQTFPVVKDFHLPVPQDAHCFRLTCHNTRESCEVKISMYGTRN